MSGSLAHTPATVLRKLMADLSLGVMPSVGTASNWPIGVGQEPDSPDNCITLYDQEGHRDGRSNHDGEVWEHYGFQVRIRALGTTDGHAKANAIKEALDKSMNSQAVTISSTNYWVDVVSRNTGILPLGKEPTTKRLLWTINATASLRQTS